MASSGSTVGVCSDKNENKGFISHYHVPEHESRGALTLGHLAVAVFRPGQFGHLGEVCCYGTGRYGTDANESTRAHAQLRNLSWMTYIPCDDHGHNKADEPSFPT